jgi:hypothetical protein
MEAKQQTKRKPNWNSDETLALASLVEENKHILRGKTRTLFDFWDKAAHVAKGCRKICSDGDGAT